MLLPETKTPLNLLLRPRDAAKALAISQRTLWTLTHHGDISYVRVGRLVRYDVRDLQAWIDRQKPSARAA